MVTKWQRVSDYVDNWAEKGDSLEEIDWRAKVKERLAEGDIEGMKQAVAPSAQWEVTKLAHETENEQLKLQALQFLLGQAGHGSVQKTEQKVVYDQLPLEQLVSVLRSKLSRLGELVPGFSAEKLLEAPVDAEIVEEITEPIEGTEPNE